MSWGLGWKRPLEIFHLTLNYGTDDFADDYTPRSSASSRSSSSSSITSSQDQQLGFIIDLDWNAVDDEDQVALRLQSQVMVALPLPQDMVEIELKENSENSESEGNVRVGVEMSVVKRREPLKVVITNGLGMVDGVVVIAEHWRSVTVVINMNG